MNLSEQNPFRDHYISRLKASRIVKAASLGARPEVVFSPTLEADLSKWRRKGYSCIGTSDVVSKAGEFGLSQQLEAQASRVGAEVVLFCIWPAKLRSVQRLPSGEIDLDVIVADSPANFSPRSYAVTSALFLARLDNPNNSRKQA